MATLTAQTKLTCSGINSDDLALDVTGDIELNADGGNVVMKDASQKLMHVSGSSFKVFNVDSYLYLNVTSNRGAATLSTYDDSGSNSGNLTIDPAGELILTPVTEVMSGAPLKIKEAASAVADTDTYGQIWVKNSDPEELYFTTGGGDDIQITSGASRAGINPIISSMIFR